ncbi:MAG: tetratricopeptide repeat protein [Candidatus Methylomirabilales bacterium]
MKQMEAKLAQDPHSLVFAQLADAYRRGGRLDEAIQICQEGLAHHLNYASAYMVLGRSYKEKGDLLAARDAFQRVLDLDGESVLAHDFVGQIAEARNEIQEAVHAYRAALILHPFDKKIREALERLQTQLESQVRKTPPAAPEVRPEPPASEPLATETLGDLYAAQGVHDHAADIYARIMTDTPDREDLTHKYEAAQVRSQDVAEGKTPDSLEGGEALRLLEAWRTAFSRLRAEQGEPTGLLEAWRDAFRRLRAEQGGPVESPETPDGPAGKVESRRREPVELLDAWRNAFRRLRTAREGTG